MSEYYQAYQFKRRKRSVYLIIAILLLIWFGKKILFPPAITSPISEHKVESIPKNSNDLDKKIREKLAEKLDQYSILVVDYTSDFRYARGESEIFTAASINKLPIVAALYAHAASGDIDLDETVTIQESDIQDYGTGSIRYNGPGQTYSIKTLAKLAITQSDNTAAYVLTNHIVGLTRLNTLIKEWRLEQTDIEQNKTSNRDISMLFRTIYEEKITNHAYTHELLSFLKDTDFKTRLPALLPSTATIYHKIGTEVRFFHDAGIVSDENITYYVGIFTRDLTDEVATDATIAEISKIIYDFMQ